MSRLTVWLDLILIVLTGLENLTPNKVLPDTFTEICVLTFHSNCLIDVKKGFDYHTVSFIERKRVITRL